MSRKLLTICGNNSSYLCNILFLKNITYLLKELFLGPCCQKEIGIKKASGYTRSNYDILIMTFLLHFMLTFTTYSLKGYIKTICYYLSKKINYYHLI